VNSQLPGHDLHAEEFLRSIMSCPRVHSDVAGPPAVAPVEEQARLALRAQFLHQRGEVGETAEPAVTARGGGKIQMGECVRLPVPGGCGTS